MARTSSRTSSRPASRRTLHEATTLGFTLYALATILLLLRVQGSEALPQDRGNSSKWQVDSSNEIGRLPKRSSRSNSSRLLFDDLFFGAIEDERESSGSCNCNCGIINQEIRIVGGRPTGVNRYPWVVRLVYDGQFHCGGSLLNGDYVLTAAHCVRKYAKPSVSVMTTLQLQQRAYSSVASGVESVASLQAFRAAEAEVATAGKLGIPFYAVPWGMGYRHHCVRRERTSRATTRLKRSKIRVILGDHDQYVTSDAPAIMRAVSLVIRHRNFDVNSYNHDIALLKLRKPVQFTKRIRPVCLPQPGLDPAGMAGTVVGWGRTEEGGQLPAVIQEVQVPILTLAECRASKYRASRITPNMMCAGKGTQDSCQGDSGGPLIVGTGEDGRNQVVGIVSWGVGCGRPGYPGVYTRVTRYLEWVRTNMRDSCVCVR